MKIIFLLVSNILAYFGKSHLKPLLSVRFMYDNYFVFVTFGHFIVLVTLTLTSTIPRYQCRQFSCSSCQIHATYSPHVKSQKDISPDELKITRSLLKTTQLLLDLLRHYVDHLCEVSDTGSRLIIIFVISF